MRRALVTGASSGIGLHLARRLAARGLEVWLAARRKELLDVEVAAINAAGGKAHALVLDISDPDRVVETLGRLDDEVGGIDLVVANAGLAGARGAIPLPKCEWADVRDLLHVNLIGSAATIHPFISRMLKRGHGHLVGVSSVSADCPIARAAPYGAGKAGLTFYLEAADIELRALGIDVTIIHPGFVKTAATDELQGMAPMPFMVPVEKMAAVIDRAIIKRRRLVRHPWIMGFVARLTAWLPRFLMAPIIRKTSG
ncbi:MAG: Oxidoreductase, short-chain dehydrogenase/reductase family [Myxococcales bacterium]|nr:Oxidoreductase, short-chain dehydrogenase/reductase family [Myxococcales bacterium]